MQGYCSEVGLYATVRYQWYKVSRPFGTIVVSNPASIERRLYLKVFDKLQSQYMCKSYKN